MLKKDLSFQTDSFGQTVQTNMEQSDQGLHCLPFHLDLKAEISVGFASLFEI